VGTGIEEFQRAGASENKNNGQIIQKYDLKPIYFRNKKYALANRGGQKYYINN
jgi:hypothetical protein